jgi:hypothetical protein
MIEKPGLWHLTTWAATRKLTNIEAERARWRAAWEFTAL